ncbi:MAG: PDDEXK nuclease domain-containing protein [Rhodoferax sp.]|uniref:PDDEXK nuclease domain-containing protein n=2 Tax=Rhodoferax sp. TaxID=50421 RepID=UPI003C72AC1B
MSKPADARHRRDNGSQPGVLMPVPASKLELPADYAVFLSAVKLRISQDRLKAQLSANAIQMVMYWDLGREILSKQQDAGWGAKIIDRLSADIRDAFPQMQGFSARNLKYMRAFAESWPDRELMQRTVAQIPWRSNLTLMEKLKDSDLRRWYARQTLQNGWSKDILAIQIDSALHLRVGQSANNFELTLPPLDSDMANQVFKDPYLFDFLGTTQVRREMELENKLVEHLEKFLLELGQGFAFVGRQVHVEVGGSDFYIDMLFYHLKLRCYVVIELKAGAFSPGQVSQLTMYMNIVNDVLRHPDDKPTIGLLLVREKNQTIAKYALTGNTQPIGVAEWEKIMTNALPADLQPSLPSVEEIETELGLEDGA